MTDTGGCWIGWGYLFRVSEARSVLRSHLLRSETPHVTGWIAYERSTHVGRVIAPWADTASGGR